MPRETTPQEPGIKESVAHDGAEANSEPLGNSESNSESVPMEVETLLGGNGRIVTVNLALGAVAVLVFLATLFFASNWFVMVLAVVGLSLAIAATVFAAMFFFTPRIAINDSELLVYLRKNVRNPYRVPLEVVEVFFIGQGAVHGTEPGHPKGYEGAVAANVIVRLAEAAHDWHDRDVQMMLGVWSEGYITVRGLFSANIDQDVLKAMNRSLMARKRRQRALKPEAYE